MHQDYRPADNLLRDRVVLVTGAGDGIGRAVAQSCAAHGASVVLLGKTIRKLEAVYDAIEAAGGPMAAIYPMHLEGATPKDYDDLARVIGDNYGRLDGLLHNAASLPYLSRIKDYDAADWLKVMQVNLNAPFFLTQACLPLLEKSSDASVLFTTDQPGNDGNAFWGGYGVSKAGVEALAHTLAAELRKTDIRVNYIDPGPTLTSLRKRVFPGEANPDLKTPSTLAPLYLWALGPDSRGTTGQRLAWDA